MIIWEGLNSTFWKGKSSNTKGKAKLKFGQESLVVFYP